LCLSRCVVKFRCWVIPYCPSDFQFSCYRSYCTWKQRVGSPLRNRHNEMKKCQLAWRIGHCSVHPKTQYTENNRLGIRNEPRKTNLEWVLGRARTPGWTIGYTGRCTTIILKAAQLLRARRSVRSETPATPPKTFRGPNPPAAHQKSSLSKRKCRYRTTSRSLSNAAVTSRSPSGKTVRKWRDEARMSLLLWTSQIRQI
jgi:hypothetical protein